MVVFGEFYETSRRLNELNMTETDDFMALVVQSTPYKLTTWRSTTDMIAASSKSGSTRSVSSSYADFDGGIVAVSSDPRRRTLEDVRLQVAQEVGVRAITQAKLSDGALLSFKITEKTTDIRFRHTTRCFSDPLDERL